ncbi:hypothetical protein [Natrinema amylolyticum]|uniref:hypothetical protein n=1 Tax=Natrinema amylolyticum TaxID=2878679 RepID=UPI001CFAB879|nr:hypothetical protein [Natrinema amylolyticum]
MNNEQERAQDENRDVVNETPTVKAQSKWKFRRKSMPTTRLVPKLICVRFPYFYGKSGGFQRRGDGFLCRFFISGDGLPTDEGLEEINEISRFFAMLSPASSSFSPEGCECGICQIGQLFRN